MKVDKYEAQALKVVSSTLLDAEMCVHCGISCSARQVFAIAVWNVFARLRIPEPLGEAKVNNVNKMLLLLNSNQEVVRLDISM